MNSLRVLAVSALIATALLMTACGGGGDSSETAGSSARTQWDIRKEMMEVQERLNAFAQEHDLTENEAVVQAEETFMNMVQEFNRIRREQPELAPLYEKSDELQSQSIKERIAGNQEAFDELMDQYRQVRSELEAKAKEIPEVIEAGEKLKAAEKEAAKAMADAAAAINARGKNIAEDLKALLDELE